MNQLREFFNKNSTYREHFLKHKLFFDGQLEFAKLGRRLLIYEPEYDQDGFDLIFDDLLYHKHFQVKSILQPAKTSSWKIHRTLLRPHILELDTHPVSPDSFGLGYGGGVLLIHASIDLDGNIATSYSFTDSLIISSFYLDILKYKENRKNESVKNCGSQLFNPYEIGEKITITQSCFLHFFRLADIFAYCGFNLPLESSQIRYCLNKAVARHCGKAQKVDLNIPAHKWKEFVYQNFLDIVDCSELENPRN